ncbi:MAG: dockerin type I repeat-containing protein [Clostridia bacterium]|nr:dockerin type I repeat-containing protein [Clostridia bacterium]
MNADKIRIRSVWSLIAAAALIVCLFAVFGTHSLAEPPEEVGIAAPPRIGDLNGDGEIDMKDVLALRLYIVSPDDSVALVTADSNGDGSVDMKDVLVLRKFIAHMVDHLGGDPADESEPASEEASEPTSTVPTARTQPTWPTKTPIDPQTPRINFIKGSDATLGVWWWMTADGVNETVREQYFDFLEENQVTEIYYYGANRLASASARQGVHTFVQAAMAHGFRVAALFDNQAVVNAGNTSFTGIAEQFLVYKQEYPDDALYGIHCDIEPQAAARANRDTWVQWVQGFADNFIVAQIAPARAQGVCVELDVGCGWWYYGKEIAYTGSATHEYDGTIMNINDIMANNCDCMCLMSYRDTAKAVLEMGLAQRAAADAAGTKIVYGVETGDDGEGAYVDFSADSKEIMYTELSRLLYRLEQDPPVGEYGFAIHRTRPWFNLRDTM